MSCTVIRKPDGSENDHGWTREMTYTSRGMTVSEAVGGLPPIQDAGFPFKVTMEEEEFRRSRIGLLLE